MSQFIGEMDAMGATILPQTVYTKPSTLQFGENNHLEYSWSMNIQERILQFYFQVTQSTNDNSIETLKLIYRNLIEEIFNVHPIADIKKEDKLLMATTLYKLIGQTRDIISGKGLYNLSYMMISEWARYSIVGPQKYKAMCEYLAREALTSFVKIESINHPYGSWKDMKYFSNYWGKIEEELMNFPHQTPNISNSSRQKPHNIMLTVLNLICTQLKQDETALENDPNTKELSLLAKWIPREKSKKFGWLTHHIAYTYYSHFLTNAMGEQNEMAARKKCLTHFRKTITKLNKALHTVQINQCEQMWRSIDFDKHVTSITLRKQSHAFQNITKKNNPRDNKTESAQEDRMQCANNYKDFITRCANKESTAKGSNVSMTDFVKSALESSGNDMEKMIINSQWEHNGQKTQKLGNIIPMVDTSASMECDNGVPLYSAIALGIRVAEKSALGRRILTFDANPEWVNLDSIEEHDFVSMAKKIKESSWGMNTNFYKALKLILDTAVTREIAPETLENMVLAVFSDMQIDFASTENMDTMFNTITKMYAEAGLKSKFKQQYSPPHILFWNLRTTNGFPCAALTKNASMMSGSSPALLNLFCEKGIHFLKDCTPWNMLQEALSLSRYTVLENTMTYSFLYMEF